MRAYPAALTPDPDGGFTVTFRDVPEAITEGDTREEALLRAEDALESALAMYIAAKEPLPSYPKPRQARNWCRFRHWGWRKLHSTTRCATKASVAQSSLGDYDGIMAPQQDPVQGRQDRRNSISNQSLAAQ
jgi:predicted RNase H-like HicB family nuclease